MNKKPKHKEAHGIGNALLNIMGWIYGFLNDGDIYCLLKKSVSFNLKTAIGLGYSSKNKR